MVFNSSVPFCPVLYSVRDFRRIIDKVCNVDVTMLLPTLTTVVQSESMVLKTVLELLLAAYAPRDVVIKPPRSGYFCLILSGFDWEKGP